MPARTARETSKPDAGPALKLQAINIEVTWDPMPDPEVEALSEDVREEMDRLYKLVQTGSPKAVAPLRKLVAANPGVLALQNWLLTVLSHGTKSQQQEARKVTMELFQLRPEYYFARTGLAELYLKDGRVEEAAALILGPANTLQELYPGQKVFHISEFRHWALLSAKIFLQKGEQEAATSYRNLLDQMEPNSPAVQHLDRLLLIALFEGSSSALQKVWRQPGGGRRIKPGGI